MPGGYTTYLPVTSDLLRVPGVRVPVSPTAANGLRVDSEIMVDLIQTSSQSRFRTVIGSLELDIQRRVEALLSLHLGLDT